MKKLIKDVGVYVGVFILLSASVWWYRQADDSPLKDSLELVREHLVDMTSNPEDRREIEKMYDDFATQVEEEKLEPGQFENAVANILNWKAQENTALTPELAQSFFLAASPDFEIKSDFAPIPEPSFPMRFFESIDFPDSLGFDAPEKIELGVEVSAPHSSPKVTQSPASPKPLPMRIPPTPEIAAQRIKIMCEFDERLKEITVQTNIDEASLRRHVRFDFEDGLKIAIDQHLKNSLSPEVLTKVEHALEELEAHKLVRWQKDVSREVHKQLRQVRRELESLERLENTAALSELAKLRSLKHLEALKAFEAFNLTHGERADSLRRVFRDRMMKQKNARTETEVEQKKN